MRHFHCGLRTTDGSSGKAAVEIIAGLVGFYLMGQVHISMAAATASTYGLGRPAALGITPTTPLQIQANDNGVPSRATTVLAWGTSPTVPGTFFHRATLPATVGQRDDFDLNDEGIWVPAGQSIVLWNLAANGVVDICFTIKE